MMMGEVEHVELKSVILNRPSTGNGAFSTIMTSYFNSKMSVALKLGKVVDPIKTHILCENQEFLHTL